MTDVLRVRIKKNERSDITMNIGYHREGETAGSIKGNILEDEKKSQ